MIFCAGMFETKGDILYSYERVKEKLAPTVIGNIKFWALIMIFLYKVVPKFFRPICDAMFSLIWSGILTYIYHK